VEIFGICKIASVNVSALASEHCSSGAHVLLQCQREYLLSVCLLLLQGAKKVGNFFASEKWSLCNSKRKNALVKFQRLH